jgi:PAS domain-containing protein
MTSNLLKILWFIIPLCGLTAALVAWPETQPPVNWSLAMLCALSLFCWSCLSVRIFGFRKRLFNFLRRLLAGDYEAGMRSRRRFPDEVSRIEDLANRLADRLRAYDRLRADRVSMHARGLDLVLRNSSDLLITADGEKEVFIFNPAAQKLLGVSRKSYSFESVLKPTVNEPFAKLFNQAVRGRKVNTAGTCFLQLPGMSAPVRLSLLLMPLRDRDENVRYTLLSIDKEKADSHEPA